MPSLKMSPHCGHKLELLSADLTVPATLLTRAVTLVRNKCIHAEQHMALLAQLATTPTRVFCKHVSVKFVMRSTRKVAVCTAVDAMDSKVFAQLALLLSMVAALWT